MLRALFSGADGGGAAKVIQNPGVPLGRGNKGRARRGQSGGGGRGGGNDNRGKLGIAVQLLCTIFSNGTKNVEV